MNRKLLPAFVAHSDNDVGKCVTESDITQEGDLGQPAQLVLGGLDAQARTSIEG